MNKFKLLDYVYEIMNKFDEWCSYLSDYEWTLFSIYLRALKVINKELNANEFDEDELKNIKKELDIINNFIER